MSLPTNDDARKSLPIWSGVIAYFPKALIEVARVSKVGNDQHNPGQPLHWARGKSMNQLDTEMRHAMDHHCFGVVRDTDGTMHLAKRAWRALADLELAIETEQETQKDVDQAVNESIAVGLLNDLPPGTATPYRSVDGTTRWTCCTDSELEHAGATYNPVNGRWEFG